ncbi:DUF779 domain-containing protein [Streptomyces sp. NBC_01618]|uniref:DUF779 domain-containing protein n=1 Tax=Streptomyces sp. NBC_01618 TaxID=2975900 RepID=UPI0038669D9C|nr:DUF779 domain-containing protein [Streptomyces sp. NBC_01618]
MSASEAAVVELTPAAADLVRRLREAHGPLMFHQSGGCCNGSAPMCYQDGEFRTGGSDVLLASLDVDGVAEAVPFWMSKSQFELWAHTRLIVDVVEGRGSGFSLEAPEGVVSCCRFTELKCVVVSRSESCRRLREAGTVLGPNG